MNLTQPPFMVFPWNPELSGVGETWLMHAFRKLKEQGLYELVFHENPTMSLSQYVNFFSRPNVAVQFCLKTNEQGEALDVAGMTWLSEIEQLPTHRRATGSFLFFREYWDRKWTIGFASIMFAWWFEELKIDVLVGMTPAANRRAIAYCKRLGMKYQNQLPGYTSFGGKPCDACIAVMTKADYEARYLCRSLPTLA